MLDFSPSWLFDGFHVASAALSFSINLKSTNPVNVYQDKYPQAGMAKNACTLIEVRYLNNNKLG